MKAEIEKMRARMREIGRQGGKATARKLGRAHFSRIGKKGGAEQKRKWNKQ